MPSVGFTSEGKDVTFTQRSTSHGSLDGFSFALASTGPLAGRAGHKSNPLTNYKSEKSHSEKQLFYFAGIPVAEKYFKIFSEKV